MACGRMREQLTPRVIVERGVVNKDPHVFITPASQGREAFFLFLYQAPRLPASNPLSKSISTTKIKIPPAESCKMETQINWEDYNELFIYCICVLEQHSHYLHYQIAQILNSVFDTYCATGEQVEAIWNKIKTIRPRWLEGFIRRAPSDPVMRRTIEFLERREPLEPSAWPTFEEVLNARAALRIMLDEMLGIPEGDLAGFSWRNE